MTRLTFLPHPQICPQGKTIEVEPGISICNAALHAGIHIEHACEKACACTTCHVVVKDGEENLSEMEDDEADRLEQAADLTLHSRLGCQAVVSGDVTVEIPAWNRNYVSEGGGSQLGDAIPPPSNKR